MEKLKPQKVFKEKKSIKLELLKALENGIKLNYSSLSKLVGISVYRIKKYCKNHNIDLLNYNKNILYTKKIKKEFEDKNIKAKNKKLKIEPNNEKINIGLPKEIKSSLNK